MAYVQKQLDPKIRARMTQQDIENAVNDSIDKYGTVRGQVSYRITDTLQTGGSMVTRKNNLKNLIFGIWLVRNHPTEIKECQYEKPIDLETALDDCLDDVRRVIGPKFCVGYDASKYSGAEKAEVIIKRIEPEKEPLGSERDDLNPDELRAKIDEETQQGYH